MNKKLLFAGIEIIDYSVFVELLLRFTINFTVVLILVRWLYYSLTKRKDYLFTYIVISSIVFMLCFMLENVKLELGFALGLFAIFGILRYRTNAIPIKEMTYLFLVIGISVINALSNKNTGVIEILFTNGIIVFIVFLYEKIWLLKHESAKTIVYEKINLIRPDKYLELIEDLRQRTGISRINRVDVGRIDFVKETCQLTIYYEDPGNMVNLANHYECTDRDDDD
jgi:hypothetical protein